MHPVSANTPIGKMQENMKHQKSQLENLEERIKYLQQECANSQQKLDQERSRSLSVASSQGLFL